MLLLLFLLLLFTVSTNLLGNRDNYRNCKVQKIIISIGQNKTNIPAFMNELQRMF